MGISDTPKQVAHADRAGIASSALLGFRLGKRKVKDMAMCQQGLINTHITGSFLV